MRISVDLPEPIELKFRNDKVQMYVGPAQHSVTVNFDGDVTVKGNGGGASSFTINVLELLDHLHQEVRSVA